MREMRKIANWKAPGPDNAQGCWLKNLTPLHDKLVVCLRDCLHFGVVPVWLKRGRTVLIQKDKANGNTASNYLLTLSMEVIDMYISRRNH